MTFALLALGVGVLAWPAARPGEARLRRLVDAARLAGPAATRAWRWRPGVPPRFAVVAGAGAAGVLGTVWHGPAVGVACGVAGAVALSCGVRASRRAAASARDRDLSAALRLLRAELDAGSTPQAALGAAAAVGGAHRRAFEAGAAAVRDGADVGTAMSVAGATGDELLVVAQAWQLATELGLPLAGVLARVDEDVQARRAQSRVVASALAGPRSSSALLAGLPVLGVVLGAAMGAHPLRVLLDSRGGQLMLCAGAALDAAGVAWTAHLVRSAERS